MGQWVVVLIEPGRVFYQSHQLLVTLRSMEAYHKDDASILGIPDLKPFVKQQINMSLMCSCTKPSK